MFEFLSHIWEKIAEFTDEYESTDLYQFFFRLLSEIIGFILSGITEGWTFLFSEFVDFFFGILNYSYDSTVSSGQFAVSRFFNFSDFGTSSFYFDFIYFYIGLLVTVFVFRFIFKIVLKVIDIVF